MPSDWMQRITEILVCTQFRLHGFRSGGGLKVWSLGDDKGNRRAYGEHPQEVEALRHLVEDFFASPNGRPYSEVYGRIYPHYLTGSVVPVTFADEWLGQGYTIDAWGEDGEVVAQAAGIGCVSCPDNVCEMARASPGERFIWRFDGAEYESVSDSAGYVASVVVDAGGQRRGGWFRDICAEERGDSYWLAVRRALKAAQKKMEMGTVECWKSAVTP